MITALWGDYVEVYNSKAEYDAFGPWIYELNDIRQLPPLFSSHYRDTNRPLMILKVPRNIERRSAVQGMNLYDYAIGMYETYIYVLERKDNSVVETKILYNEVCMIENFTDLLFGRLTLLTTSGKLEILYNTSSGECIAKVVNLIRARYTSKKYSIELDACTQMPDTEIRYSNFLASMKCARGDFDVSVVQPSVAAKPVSRNLFIKLLNAVFKREILPSLHLLNSKELLIISRGKAFKHVDSVYSCALNCIPLEKIRDISFGNDSTYANLQRVNIVFDSYTREFYLDTANKSAQEFYMDLKKIILSIAG